MKQRLIDANDIGVKECDPNQRLNRAYVAGWNGVVHLINKAPTIDPIQALGACYCRECKWKPKCVHHKESEGGIFGDNDFCSYGERRTPPAE